MSLNNNMVESAFLVYSHHIGLQSIPEEQAKAELFLRDANIYKHTEQFLNDYLMKHVQADCELIEKQSNLISDWNGLTRRIALSCLVDADHGDTAYNYGKESLTRFIEPRWEERLDSLDKYIERLQKEYDGSKRAELRNKIYNACKETDTNLPIYSCDSPVGTGKTTAVMVHLLRTAIAKNLRHIIIVLPYTNIIKQSVDIYRKALVLKGENPYEVVAEHHHQADFDSLETRHLSTLWKSPIIVTTAVQFFETIASNHPSKLRKLNELPGSGIFIDEAHSAIPNHLWPLTWKWINEFAKRWSCYFVIASGSLPRFWELKDLMEIQHSIPELIPQSLRDEALKQESERIQPVSYRSTLNDEQLMHLVLSKNGPRLVILNTVQSAAVLADKLAKKLFAAETYSVDIRTSKVLHLSTSLAPKHRNVIVEEIKRRLNLPLNDQDRDFTLVATSCVEAGLDFSFRTAFRESASAANLIQVGGRVRRNIEDFEPTLIDFKVEGPLFNRHPAFTISRQILEKLFEEKRFETDAPADLITEALRREIMSDTQNKHKRLLQMEEDMNYPEVDNLYKVIAADTRFVLIDEDLIAKIENHEKVEPREILYNSVQIWANKIDNLGLKPLRSFFNSGIYEWCYEYDPDFLGYMKGLLPILYADAKGFEIF
ncbi:CRISPR-associated helicase/endonuclease Cas3 [Melioribacter sp. OK-1-Me]|uniref:CRISPR-associated helicase/endonuclease Cas3 n=2 Tax=unclassified Melioribacter TaxID=2627329 RepID=UPI004044D58C